MHMSSPPAEVPILTGDLTLMANYLWRKLNPHQWPLAINSLPAETVLVGGAVRDGLLDRLKENPDLDLIVPNHAIKLTQTLAKDLNGTSVILDEQRDIARLILDKWTIDLAKQQGQTLEDDLYRRDFRINSIALRISPEPQLIDPLGGIEDLQTKTLVAIQEKNLRDDPLRCLRAFRLMAEINLTLDPQTQIWINNNHKLLRQVAPERVQSELMRLVNGRWADDVFHILKKGQLLNLWANKNTKFNEQTPSLNNAKNLSPTEQKVALSLARLTHLLSDEGLQKLRFSRRQCERCKRLRKWINHSERIDFKSLSEADRLQLHIDLEDDLPALILYLPKDKQLNWIRRWRNKKDHLFHPNNPLNGYELQKKFDIPSGVLLGKLMRHLRHEQAFGRLQDRADALQKAHYWLHHNQALL